MHFYKRHLGDIAKKTAHLSPLEFGIYNLILDGYYAREQAPTLLEATRWARARTPDEKEAVLGVLDEFFVIGDDERYRQPRVDEEVLAYHKKAEKNREIGKLGGRPAKNNPEKTESEPKNNPNGFHGNPNGFETVSKNNPNHKPVTSNQEPDKKHKAPAAADAELFPGVDPQVVADFKAIRKQKRAPVTLTAMQAIQREAEKARMTLDDALRVCCARGWQGFKAEWLAPSQKSNGRPSINSMGGGYGDDPADPFSQLRRS